MTRSLPDNIHLGAMKPDDFGLVAELGKTIWYEYYIGIISREQVDYMLDGRYSPENLQEYIGSSERCLMLLRIDGKAAGYCSFALVGDAEMKLEQLYLLGSFRHRGLGKAMLDYIEMQARQKNVHTLTLQVNKQNAGAIAFYRNNGFSVRKEAVFDIGNGFVMDDYVMIKTV